MIPIFDLDDTLYPERAFVESGFRAVACELEDVFGWPLSESLQHMLATLESEGRGAVFNRLLEDRGYLSVSLVRKCVHTYRYHRPEIQLAPEAERLLDNLQTRPYLVTDGHKVVQKRKVEALGIASRFSHIYITHRYGIRNAKPSTYCFDLIRRRSGSDWRDMFYVGDNPAKDFVNLNPLGVHTIRVLTGEHASEEAKPGFNAKHVISSLDELPIVLNRINHEQ